eukprot:scaffold22639_cov105-Cylindrotheca_fusiformis.AAC.12
MSRRYNNSNNDNNSYYSDDHSYDYSSNGNNSNVPPNSEFDIYTDGSSSNPDSVRSGRPDTTYETRPSDRFPAANDQYQDEYDSAEESDEDDDYHDDYNRGIPAENNYEYRNDEAEETRELNKKKRRDERDANRGKKIVAACCCCCICLITILVLILILIVFKEKDGGSPGSGPGSASIPTPKPTPRPSYPLPPALRPSESGGSPWLRYTEAPTISPYPTQVASSNPTEAPTRIPTSLPTISPAPTKKVPKEITIDAVDDTYIYVDGFFQYEAFGQEDTFLVQNGLKEYYEFADALGLIAFDLTELPTAQQMVDYSAQAILKLNHNPVAPQFNSRGPSTIEIFKLVSTAMRIETIHGGMLNKNPEGAIRGENTFTVEVNQPTVQVDISDLLYPANFTEYDKNQLFLMLLNNGTEQGDPKWTELQFQDQAGDRFQSVESGHGPQLTVTYQANNPADGN